MITDVEPDTAANARTLRTQRQIWLLLFAFGAGVLALLGGIVLADVVFPEPTMWRLPLMATVFAAAAVAVRRRVRRADPDDRRAQR